MPPDLFLWKTLVQGEALMHQFLSSSYKQVAGFSPHHSAFISCLSCLTHLSCWLLVGQACELFQANTRGFHHCVVSCSEPTCGCLLWWHDLVFCSSVSFFLLPWYFVPLSQENSSSEAAAFLLWSYRMHCIASGNTVLLNTDEIATNPLRSGV